jgi:hypothetical protein
MSVLQGLNLSFDDDVVVYNSRRLDALVRHLAGRWRARLYQRTIVRRMISHLDLLEELKERYGPESHMGKPVIVVFMDEPDVAHIAVHGLHWIDYLVGCGGGFDDEQDVKDGFTDEANAIRYWRSEREVTCTSCLLLMEHAEKIRARRKQRNDIQKIRAAWPLTAPETALA